MSPGEHSEGDPRQQRSLILQRANRGPSKKSVHTPWNETGGEKVPAANSKKTKAERIPLVETLCIYGAGVGQEAGHGPGPALPKGIFRTSC